MSGEPCTPGALVPGSKWAGLNKKSGFVLEATVRGFKRDGQAVTVLSKMGRREKLYVIPVGDFCRTYPRRVK